jgi:hypothetical protein
MTRSAGVMGEGMRRQGLWAPRPRSGARGLQNENVAPGPLFDSAQRRPQWFSIFDRLTNRSMPIPPPLGGVERICCYAALDAPKPDNLRLFPRY